MKNIFEGKHFANMIEVKQKTAEALKGIKIDEVRNYFEHKKKKLYRCIASNGEYFDVNEV